MIQRSCNEHLGWINIILAGYRTIRALWKGRALSPEQKVQIVEEESEAKRLEIAEDDSIAKNLHSVDEETEGKNLQSEESGSFLGDVDVNMSTVYSSVLSIPVSMPIPFSLFHFGSCRCLFWFWYPIICIILQPYNMKVSFRAHYVNTKCMMLSDH